MSRLELIADVFTDVGCGSRSGIRPAEVGGDSIRPVSSACSAKRSHWRDSSSYSRLVPKLSAASAYCWHFSAFARYRSDRDDIKPPGSPFEYELTHLSISCANGRFGSNRRAPPFPFSVCRFFDFHDGRARAPGLDQLSARRRRTYPPPLRECWAPSAWMVVSMSSAPAYQAGEHCQPPWQGCLLREGGNVGNLPRKSIKPSMS
jgi:hypothetical protein